MFPRIRWWLLQWAVLCAAWLLLVDTLRWTEVVAGIGAAAIAAAATEAVRGEEHPHFLPYFSWVRLFARIPGEVVRDHWLLIRHLARITRDRRCAEGCFQAFPFTARGEDARAIARRTLTILYITLPPNTIVIGIDRRRNQLLLHLLEPAPLPDTVRQLETCA